MLNYIKGLELPPPYSDFLAPNAWYLNASAVHRINGKDYLSLARKFVLWHMHCTHFQSVVFCYLYTELSDWAGF